MVPYLSAADALRDAFKCVVILIHHCGHDDSRPRGHSSLTGNVDAQIAVKRDTAQNVVATVECMKDGPEGASFVNRLEPLEVGRDGDGNPVTSCVVEPVEGEAPKTSPSTRPRKLNNAAKIAKRALAEAINEADAKAPPSSSIPPTAMIATVDHWRTIAFRIGISTSDKSHAQQVAFSRATQMLIADGHVGFSDPYAWLIK